MAVNAQESLQAPAGGKARRFVGTSLREVYAQVRAELGADALILEQHAANGRIEVIAGLDPGDSTMLLSRDRMVARLRELGLGPAALARLPAALRSPLDVERALSRAVPCAPPAVPLCGRFRFVGPPGAGKTTALIKLAASRVLRYGRYGTVLIGTDRSRLAGCEQLASSAELLGVEYVECAEQALPEVLEKWRHMQLVLVDAAGVRGDATSAPVADVQDVLVVPAVWQSAALRRLRERYLNHPLSGVIVSHADQAETLWECISLLVEWQLPVWWLGHGGDLSAELEPAYEATFARSLMTPFDRSALQTMFAK